jgi:ABC-type branched-subunit amino acid transport system ATPase component
MALEVSDLKKSFGALAALDGIDLTVPTGVIVGLIGPNGSGKSTLVETISGLQTSDSGTIRLNGTDVTSLAPHQRAQLGLRRTFQVSRLWQRMSVAENLLVAMPPEGRDRWWRAYLQRGVTAEIEKRSYITVRETLESFGLWRLRNEAAANLSGGQGRLLEFARIMVSGASVALLDEPLAGVNPVMAQTVVKGVRDMAASGITVLIVEHDLSAIEDLCSNVYGMERGRIVVSGTMKEIAATEFFSEAYIGRSRNKEARP